MKLLNVTMLLVLLSGLVQANKYDGACQEFSREQREVLHMAFITGYPYDRGYTLAAIVWKESMVGDYVIRVNGGDGNKGSFGVGHMQLTTAMYLIGEDSIWRAKAKLTPKMINNDAFSLDLSMKYLLRWSHLNWFNQIKRYNGQGPMADAYAVDVVERVRKLQSCHFFEE